MLPFVQKHFPSLIFSSLHNWRELVAAPLLCSSAGKTPGKQPVAWVQSTDKSSISFSPKTSGFGSWVMELILNIKVYSITYIILLIRNIKKSNWLEGTRSDQLVEHLDGIQEAWIPDLSILSWSVISGLGSLKKSSTLFLGYHFCPVF